MTFIEQQQRHREQLNSAVLQLSAFDRNNTALIFDLLHDWLVEVDGDDGSGASALWVKTALDEVWIPNITYRQWADRARLRELGLFLTAKAMAKGR
jgi:hypothetical protein